jgi:hypothetical protein
MKLQNPKSKIQKNSKIQAPSAGEAVKYPEVSSPAGTLNEGDADGSVMGEGNIWHR